VHKPKHRQQQRQPNPCAAALLHKAGRSHCPHLHPKGEEEPCHSDNEYGGGKAHSAPPVSISMRNDAGQKGTGSGAGPASAEVSVSTLALILAPGEGVGK
jgi:hypothetical protein